MYLSLYVLFTHIFFKFRVAYTRKVNPNRVHVSTELSIDKEKSSVSNIIIKNYFKSLS